MGCHFLLQGIYLIWGLNNIQIACFYLLLLRKEYMCDYMLNLYTAYLWKDIWIIGSFQVAVVLKILLCLWHFHVWLLALTRFHDTLGQGSCSVLPYIPMCTGTYTYKTLSKRIYTWWSKLRWGTEAKIHQKEDESNVRAYLRRYSNTIQSSFHILISYK